MDDTKVFTQEQKTESLRKALIEAGYDMASSQAESMKEDTESWGEDMIEGKINPKCIDISDQASHSFYNNELDIWFEPDEELGKQSWEEQDCRVGFRLVAEKEEDYLARTKEVDLDGISINCFRKNS